MNELTLVYLSGPPAAGKSTLMAELTAACTRVTVEQPIPHHRLITPTGSPAAELGRRRPSFSGTDALAMSIQPRAVAWVADTPYPLLLAEGDRLANMGFLTAAAAAGYQVHLLTLYAPADVLDARCAARGSTQKPAWRAGRATKAYRLHDRAAHTPGFQAAVLDANAPAGALADRCRERVPALALLAPPLPGA